MFGFTCFIERKVDVNKTIKSLSVKFPSIFSIKMLSGKSQIIADA